MDDVSTPDDGTPAVAPEPEVQRHEPQQQERRHQRHDQEEPPPDTGDELVDEATAEVAATFGESLETRLAAYERAHRTLQDRLADVEG